MRFGKGKGCDFLKKRCIDSNQKINPLFGNEFFDSIKSDMDASCSSGRQSRAYHYFGKYNDLPSYYQYFSNKRLGGYYSADYCPVSRSSLIDAENAYYTGHCSLKGNGQYGHGIKYPEKEEKYNDYYTSESLEEITGETYSDHSFCYQSSLIKDGINFNY